MKQIPSLRLGIGVAVTNEKPQAPAHSGARDAQLLGQRLFNQDMAGIERLDKGQIEPSQVACRTPHQTGGKDGMPHRCTRVRLIIDVIGDGD